MSDIDDLFNASKAELKKGLRVEDADTRPAEFVQDSSHMKELINTVLKAALAPADDIAKWKAAGHRLVGLWEEPMVVEGYLSREHPCDVRVFRNSIRILIDKTRLGTAIYALATKQVTARWELAGYRIEDETLTRNDQRVAARSMDGTTDEILPGEAMDGKIDDFGERKLRAIRVWFAWIDSAGAEPLEYDVHGKTKEPTRIVVQPAAPAPQVIYIERGNQPTAEDLVAMAQGRAKVEMDEKPLHWRQKKRLEELEAAEKARNEGGA